MSVSTIVAPGLALATIGGIYIGVLGVLVAVPLLMEPSGYLADSRWR